VPANAVPPLATTATSLTAGTTATAATAGTTATSATAATAVRRGVIRLGRRLRLERPAHDVTLLQLGILAELNDGGPMTPGDLAAAQRVQPQSLTRVLATLETRQLIGRQAHPGDGRRALLAITADALRRDVDQRDSWLARAMAAQLTPTEQELLRLAGELMERLAAANTAASTAANSAGGPS
jgi:DNA-binding MarR family transcriptional regulator